MKRGRTSGSRLRPTSCRFAMVSARCKVYSYARGPILTHDVGHKTMKTIIAVIALTASLIPAIAGSFVMVDDQNDTAYGPFDYEDQNTILIGDAKLTLKIVDKPETKLERLAKEIIIPNVEFRQAHIADILQFLREASIQCCPGGTNVNIVLNVTAPETVGREATNKATLALRNVSLYDALRYTTEVLGLKIRYDDSAAVITK